MKTIQFPILSTVLLTVDFSFVEVLTVLFVPDPMLDSEELERDSEELGRGALDSISGPV